MSVTTTQDADPAVLHLPAPVPTQHRYDVDAFVARYAAVWAYGVADPGRTSEPYYRFVLDVAGGGTRPSSILEVGCGPGRVIADLADAVPTARCTAVDASAAMVALARRIIHPPVGGGVVVDAGDFGFAAASIPTRGRPDVRLAHCRLEDLDPRDRYDLVVASHLLDRVDSPPDALRRLAALVAPGGSLVVACAFNYEQRHHWSLACGDDVARLLRELGLTVTSLDDDVPYRERLDARGTVTEHVVAVLRAEAPR